MDIRVAICDDEQLQTIYLRTLVTKWAVKNKYIINVNMFDNAESFLANYDTSQKFDILLLDIEMGEMNGVELARKIRAENKEVQIIFITGFMDYISEGYDVEALHYLLKPVNESKLFDVLNRAVIKLNRNNRILTLESNGEITRLPLYDIYFLEVQRNYVTVHAKEKYTIKKTLSELEEELDESFFRTGRSFVVNLRYVRKITKTEVYLSDGSSVPLSRGFYDTINRAMIEHF